MALCVFLSWIYNFRTEFQPKRHFGDEAMIDADQISSPSSTQQRESNLGRLGSADGKQRRYQLSHHTIVLWTNSRQCIHSQWPNRCFNRIEMRGYFRTLSTDDDFWPWTFLTNVTELIVARCAFQCMFSSMQNRKNGSLSHHETHEKTSQKRKRRLIRVDYFKTKVFIFNVFKYANTKFHLRWKLFGFVVDLNSIQEMRKIKWVVQIIRSVHC